MVSSGDLSRKLNKIISHEPEKPSSPQVVLEPSFNECLCKGLLESHLYVYIPFKPDLQARVKEEIQRYVKKTNVHFVVTTQKDCPGDMECNGHYVDPFKAAIDDGHIFVDAFPEDINGAYIHFLNQKNYRIFEEIRKPE